MEERDEGMQVFRPHHHDPRRHRPSGGECLASLLTPPSLLTSHTSPAFGIQTVTFPRKVSVICRTTKTCFFWSRDWFHVRPNYSHKPSSRSSEAQLPTKGLATRMDESRWLRGGDNPRMGSGSRSARQVDAGEETKTWCVRVRRKRRASDWLDSFFLFNRFQSSPTSPSTPMMSRLSM